MFQHAKAAQAEIILRLVKSGMEPRKIARRVEVPLSRVLKVVTSAMASQAAAHADC